MPTTFKQDSRKYTLNNMKEATTMKNTNTARHAEDYSWNTPLHNMLEGKRSPSRQINESRIKFGTASKDYAQDFMAWFRTNKPTNALTKYAPTSGGYTVPDEMEKRLKNITTRGILLLPGQSLRGMYDERVPLYERYADITVASPDGDLELVVGSVIEAL